MKTKFKTHKNEINENFQIEKLVFQTFLKYIKERKLYIYFRMAINYNNVNRDIFQSFIRHYNSHFFTDCCGKLSQSEHASTNASSLLDILQIMQSQKGKNGNIAIENTREFQMVIMNLVNSLLHNCIEYAVRDNMKVLEEIGSQIFEECCTKLLGDSFEDLTQKMIDKNGKPIDMDFPYKDKIQIKEMIESLKSYHNWDFDWDLNYHNKVFNDWCTY